MEKGISMNVLKAVLRRVPVILKAVLLKVLFLSPVKGKQSFQMEIIVTFIRSFFNFEVPASKLQRNSMKDPGIEGNMWISKVQLPKPFESEILDALLRVIEYHKEGSETYDIPDLRGVGAEWTGYRKGAHPKTPLPDISEEEKYKALMDDIEEDLTILYFHGGAYHMMDPCTHRKVTVKLAKLTRGRCLSVRYRLAPEFPFPAALLDALVAYLSLLSPPEGSLYAPVPGNKIILAGDSAGGGLSLALLQTLLTLQRTIPSKTVRFNGKDVPIQLPAGLAASSPYCDLTRSLPSTFNNAKYDYIITPHLEPGTLYTPMPFPPDAMWPVSPPRLEFYANANMLAHPLVSPVSGSKEIWKDAPPIFFTLGEECLEDEGIYLARKINRLDGTQVKLERFEGMPHCFAMITPKTNAARRCFEGLATFCLDAFHDRVRRSGEILYINHTATKAESRNIDDVGSLSDKEVQEKVMEGKNWRDEGEKHLVRQWLETKPKANL